MAGLQLKTFKDIQDAVLEELKIQAGDTNEVARIKRDINIVYINEVIAAKRWYWLRGKTTVQAEPAFFLGKVNVLSNSNQITLTESPASSKKGYYFSTVDFDEIYEIESHVAGTNTMTLSLPYMGKTNTEARFYIWTDSVRLPVDLRETEEVKNAFDLESLNGIGLQEFEQTVQLNPKMKGRPEHYSTSDYVQVDPYQDITGLPSSSTRTSNGLLKTLTFSSDVSSLLEAGDRIEVSGSAHRSYNGEFVVASVSTTDVTYIGESKKNETAQEDTSIVVRKLESESNEKRYRSLLIYPSILESKTTLQVNYIKQPEALENDTDEPQMPLEDRVILLYGALVRAWRRERNPEESANATALFVNKLNEMMNKYQDSMDYPVLQVSKDYLFTKRNIVGRRNKWRW